jgi:hypothetical protein
MCAETPSPSLGHSCSLKSRVQQLCTDLHGAKHQIEALEDMQDVNNSQLALASFQVERSHCQLSHHEKKQKMTHHIKIAVEGEVVTHDDFLDCVNRAEAMRMEKEACKVANKDCHLEGKRNAAAKGELVTHQTQAWEAENKQSEAAELCWKEKSVHCLKEGCALPKKPVPLKWKGIWVALESASGTPGVEGGSGPAPDNETSSESSDEDDV